MRYTAEFDIGIVFFRITLKRLHFPVITAGRGGSSDFISMITFYSDYSKAEVDAVITFQ